MDPNKIREQLTINYSENFDFISIYDITLRFYISLSSTLVVQSEEQFAKNKLDGWTLAKCDGCFEEA